MEELVSALIKQSGRSTISNNDIHLQLLSHHDYPSLKAITDTLDYFTVENVAANVPTDALAQLPISFLALIDQKNGQELVYVSQTKKGLKIRDAKGKTQELSSDTFKEIWTGTIIAIEKETSLKKATTHLGITTWVLSLFLFLFLASLIFGDFNWNMGIYISLSLLGIFLSILIVKEDLGYTSVITQKVCGAISQNEAGCSSIINSKQGKIAQGIGLGDVSLVYFTSLSIASTFLTINEVVFYGISIIALPIVAYSVYLQAFKLKEWCALCLGIGAVLVAQFAVLYFNKTLWRISIEDGFHVLFFVSIIAATWLYIKPLLKKKKELAQVQTDFLKFKRDEEVFQSLLERNEVPYSETLPEEAQMRFGKKEAAIQLTAYTNPLCGYCTEAFKAYDHLLAQHPDDVSVQFIFNTPDDIDNPGTRISKKLFELYVQDKETAFNAFRNWFQSKDIEAWQERFGKAQSLLDHHDITLDKHRALVIKNNIGYTPETLIGHYKYPRAQYEYKDLILFSELLKRQKKRSSFNISLQKEEHCSN